MDNAVVWFTGAEELPEISLPLPHGTRMPVPSSDSVLPSPPAWFSGPPGGVACQLKIPRTDAGLAYAKVLSRRLYTVLRHYSGLSYSTSVSLSAMDDKWAELRAIADDQPGKAQEAVDAFVGVFQALATGTLPQDEVDTVLAPSDSDDRSDSDVIGLAAYDYLVGYPVRSVADEQSAPVPCADVRRVADDAYKSMVLMVPRDCATKPAGMTQAPLWSDSIVAGAGYGMTADKTHVLYLGADGISAVSPDRRVTVYYKNCVAMLAWPDGRRVLVGSDALSVTIEPNLYPTSIGKALGSIDAAIGPDRTVWQPAREQKDIPARAKIKWDSPTVSLAGVAAVMLIVAMINRKMWWLFVLLAAVILVADFLPIAISFLRRPSQTSPGLTNLPQPEAGAGQSGKGRVKTGVWQIVAIIALVVVCIVFAVMAIGLATYVGGPSDNGEIVGVAVFAAIAVGAVIGIIKVGGALLKGHR